ncbi:MAG: hypothetical protein PHT69_11975 [Bacteroidales bacterium]|nr:hypothetical protein [Bacteroidales bacterium]
MLNLISAVGSAACGINSLAWDASGRKEVNPDFIRKSSHPDNVVVGRKLILILSGSLLTPTKLWSEGS